MSGLETAAMIAGGIGTAASAGGTLLGGYSGAGATEAEGRANLIAGLIKAQQYRQQADEQRGASQREAYQTEQQKQLLLSKAQAVSAASGGGATDTSVANLEAGIEKQGEFEKLMQLYQGESRARGFEDAATNAVISGVNQKAAADYQAGMSRFTSRLGSFGTLLSGGAGLYRYGRRGFNQENYG